MSTVLISFIRSLNPFIKLVFTTGVLLAWPSNAQLICDAPQETFSTGIPVGWAVIDAVGDGLIWGDLAACGEASNFTGGQDGAACASSDRFGVGAFATELRSAPLDLSDATTPVLRFRANYQPFSSTEILAVELSQDGGSSWDRLLDLDGSRGLYRRAVGEELELDLTPYAGLDGLLLRWLYVDADPRAFDGYIQIDDVGVSCAHTFCSEPLETSGIVDGGFEEGTGWTASSSRFGTPLCTAATCGLDGARSGEGWVFFSGAEGEVENAFVEQSVVLLSGLATLSFHLWVPQASENGEDVLRVLLDGNEVARIRDDERRFRAGYRKVELDLSPFADGEIHQLRFEVSLTGSSNFLLDDVGLEICTAVLPDPDISVGDIRVVEGHYATTSAVFTVKLLAPSQHPITVDYATSDITARLSDGDYEAQSGTLTFPPGTQKQTVAVSVQGDTVDEGDESFQLTLANPSRGRLFRATGTAVIENDDQAYLSISDGAALEQDTASTRALFTAYLSSPSNRTVIVDYASSDGTAIAGSDYMAAVGSLSFPPGTTSQPIQIEVAGDVRVERDETFFVDLRNPSGAVIDRDRGTATIHDNDRGRFPVVGGDVLYTESVDFEQGRLLNVHHGVPDQLQLTRRKTTYPNLWIAASARGTLVRVDTRTGAILGEYATSPDSSPDPNPSRTTVALDGTVWAGNRGDGSVIHIGLVEESQCVDRNGNGVIETSSGYGDVLPWPNSDGSDTGGGVSTAVDECILHYLEVTSTGTRHLSIDRDNNVWVSGHLGGRDGVFELLDGATGALLESFGPFACGGYGGFVDRRGVVWSATYNSSVLRFDPATGEARCLQGIQGYGLALDPEGRVWVSAPSGDQVWRISSDGETISGPFVHGSHAAQGLAVDGEGHVWVSSGIWGASATIGHLLADGTFLGNVTGLPEGSSGVAVDVDGHVWVAHAPDSTLSRINPRLGPVGSDGRTPIGQVDLTVPLPGSRPYNYSDMTGALALGNTSPQGTWQVIQDSGEEGARWELITWNTEAEGSVPAGTVLSVEARAASSTAGLGGESFREILNGVPFDLVGRYLQARVTLRAGSDDASPVLSDLRITKREEAPALPSLVAGNVVVFESDAGAVPATFTVRLSEPSPGDVQVAYETVVASATAGTDFTPASGILSFSTGSREETVTVNVLGDTAEEEDESFFLRLSQPQGAVLADASGTCTIHDDDLRIGPVPGTCVRYTLDEDFDRGRLFNVHHDAPTSHQLQVTDELHPFPYIWVALSLRGTIGKIDTRTGAVLGEYSTNPDNRGEPDPSRTTVALDGSVWVGNRNDSGSVAHIGLLEEGQCIDRNGNGIIETSRGYGDVLAWPNTNGNDHDGGIETALDECLLKYIRVTGTGTRHLSLDADNNLWVGGRFGLNDRIFQLIDSTTGEILRTEGPLPCGGYGGFIDQNGVLWSGARYGPLLRWNIATGETRCIDAVSAYGLDLAPDGWVWVSEAERRRVFKVSPDGNTVLGSFFRGSYWAQGLTVDNQGHAWISSSLVSGGLPLVSHLRDDGTYLGDVTVPSGSTGLAVDAAGKVWAINLNSSNAVRIDPSRGPLGRDGLTPLGEVDLTVNLPGSSPYNYSDMTGRQALRNTSPRGTWTVIQDGGRSGTSWGTITWNSEGGSVPEGASIAFEARAADTVAGLGGRPFLAVQNGVPFALSGRYLEARAVLRPNRQGQSPTLTDLELCAAELGLPSIAIDDVTVAEGDGGSVPAVFTLSLSSPSSEAILVDYDTVDQDATAGADYQPTLGRVVFAPGTTSRQVSVEVLADMHDEADETFLVELSYPQGATLADGQGVGTILDDEPSVELSIREAGVSEGDEDSVEAIFVLELSGPTERIVRVDYATADQSATGGVDYQPTTGYLEFLPGVRERRVAVEVFGDLEPEADETFLMVLSHPDGADATALEAVGTIFDDDQQELGIDDVTVEEGDTGTVEAIFTVHLAQASADVVRVDFSTVADSATEGVDYEPVTGTVLLEPGEVTATIAVPVLGDVLLEDDETFRVELSSPQGATLVDGVGVGTILDDELCPGPNLLINPSNEAGVAIDGQLAGWTSLGSPWARRTSPPPAVEGEATFFPGAQASAELYQDIDLTAYAAVIDGPGQVFAFEGFVRTLDESPSDEAEIVVEYRDEVGEVLDSYATGPIASPDVWHRVEDVRQAPVGSRRVRVRLLATRSGEGDVDAYFDALALRSLRTPTLVVEDTELYEGDVGTTDAVLTVRLSCLTPGLVTVGYMTVDDTARAGEDYLATSGEEVIPEGAVELAIAVPVIGDEQHEAHEIFHLVAEVLSAEREVVLIDPQSDGRIVNDDFCSRSPGFWKNHVELWPVNELTLGEVGYGPVELLAFLEYGGPDASLHLARQLVATLLNLAVGSDPAIVSTVEEADRLLQEFPPGSNPRGRDKQRVGAVKDDLDAYNTLDCEEDPVIPPAQTARAKVETLNDRVSRSPRPPDSVVVTPLDRAKEELP